MFGRRKSHHPTPTPPAPAQHHEDFARIYATYAGRITAYALQRLRDPDLAADITSTVFTRALARLDAFEPHESGEKPDSSRNFEGWLMTIARNAIIDHVRADKRLTILDPDSWRAHINATTPDPANAAVAPDERDQLLDALHRLGATQQRIVLLRLQGWNGVEIAELLGMSHGAVRTAQHRAYSRLRELLETDTGPSSTHAFSTEPDHV